MNLNYKNGKVDLSVRISKRTGLIMVNFHVTIQYVFETSENSFPDTKFLQNFQPINVNYNNYHIIIWTKVSFIWGRADEIKYWLILVGERDVIYTMSSHKIGKKKKNLIGL